MATSLLNRLAKAVRLDMPRDIMLLILAVFMNQGLARGFLDRDHFSSDFAKVVLYDSVQADIG